MEIVDLLICQNKDWNSNRHEKKNKDWNSNRHEKKKWRWWIF